jgi:hypothetical protein
MLIRCLLPGDVVDRTVEPTRTAPTRSEVEVGDLDVVDRARLGETGERHVAVACRERWGGAAALSSARGGVSR